MANFKNIVKVNGDQWAHLVEYGSISISGTVYYLDENTIYEINDGDNYGYAVQANASQGTSSYTKTWIDWSEVKKYKFIMGSASEGTGTSGQAMKGTILIPVNLIPLIAQVYTSTSSAPTSADNFAFRFSSRLWVSGDTTTKCQLTMAFALVEGTGTTTNPENQWQLCVYTKNDSSASRTIRIDLVGRNADVY